MKATLHFNLPEDNDDYLAATKAGDMRGAIIEIHDYLRTHQKYTDPSKLPTLAEVRTEFHQILDERGLAGFLS
jgi:hypothetical protein